MRETRGVRRSRHAPVAAVSPTDPIDPIDCAELESRLSIVGSDEHLAQRLAIRVAPLIARQVPVRGVEPAPSLRAMRIRFGDGTTVIVRGLAPGDAAVLGVALRDHPVPPAACTTLDDIVLLSFHFPAGHRHITVQLLGLDQPD